MARQRIAIEQRFWAKVKKAGVDECWEWQGAIQNEGYGLIRATGPSRRLLLAHRVSWMFANGLIPAEMCICHHCDNPSCCNPRHLFLGTLSDNSKDAFAKGRMRMPHGVNSVGEKNSQAKLNGRQVLEILDMYPTERYTQAELAAIYGVAQSTIWRIVNQKTWKHLRDKEG